VDKALGYGVDGMKVDGNDVVACYETMKKAVSHARGGGGSVLIEAMTYRRKGHAEHDNQAYVPEGEIAWWAENNDPIDRYERFLRSKKILSGKMADRIGAEIKDLLARAAEEAEDAPLPQGEEAAFGVFDNRFMEPAFRKKILER